MAAREPTQRATDEVRIVLPEASCVATTYLFPTGWEKGRPPGDHPVLFDGVARYAVVEIVVNEFDDGEGPQIKVFGRRLSPLGLLDPRSAKHWVFVAPATAESIWRQHKGVA